MAIPPTASAAPMPDGGDDSDQDAGTADAGASQGDDSQDGPTVLLTVMDNHDGSFTLMEGDENDGTSPDSGAADDPMAGATGGGADAGAGSDAPQGQTFDSAPKLLKGIMDLLNKAEAASPNSAQSNFESGFGGGASSAPVMATQKY